MLSDEISKFSDVLFCHADDEQAKSMAAYMLDKFQFLGIRATLRRQIATDLIKLSKAHSADEIIAGVNILWQMPYREFQYIAIDMLAANSKKFAIPDIEQLLSLITIKSWWDSVDGLISVISKIMLRLSDNYPHILKIIAKNSNSTNIWLVRMAILHQNGWKAKTNHELLFSLALQHSASEEFFIRKAIGWALRDYAKFAPELVYAFVDENRDKFSGLTYREATKHRR